MTALSREQLRAFLGEMLLIPRFDEKVTERFRAGDLAGTDPEPEHALKYVYAPLGAERQR
jgi:hypothetical protein